MLPERSPDDLRLRHETLESPSDLVVERQVRREEEVDLAERATKPGMSEELLAVLADTPVPGDQARGLERLAVNDQAAAHDTTRRGAPNVRTTELGFM